MRIVLDTNIYIAAVLHNGLSKQVVNFVFENSSITLITSNEILEELSSKLRDKFEWSKEKINYYLSDIKTISETVQTEIKVTLVKRDPEDNKILECALSGDADLIITLDQDLIKLKNFRGVGIIHPKTFSWILPDLEKNNR